MKAKKLLLAAGLLGSLSLVACGGGGGGSGNVSTGGVYLTHSQLANEFVNRLQIDSGYDVTLVKTNTRQTNYVVVYDYDYGTYDAYDLTYFTPGQSMSSFLYNNEYSFYYDLDPVGADLYQDYYSGVIFNKAQATSKDHMKLAAFEEALSVKKASEALMVNYGLSASRSEEVAKLSVLWHKTPKELMTDADHDRFGEAVLGSSITNFKGAINKKLSGDGAELERLIGDAAKVNGISSDEVHNIVTDVFGVSL